ncbi:MAG: glycosyltransferase [Phycisphaerales bacterium]|nr:glycosyltransferase [Phycisphaerae bacterium]NNM25957.1 glycosyltransferase [Phycisphaerales bacterium]
MELSIIIPVYDAERTLARTLRSLEHIAPRHRDDVEVVLVDDGSNDESSAIADTFFAAGLFPHVHRRAQANAGSAAARNAGLEIATGRWLYLLDADDELACDPIDVIASAPDASVIGCRIELHRHGTPRGQRRPRHVSRSGHLAAFTAGHPNFSQALIARRDHVDVPFDPRWPTLEDWVFWMSNPRVFDRMELRPEVTLAIIHAHGANKSRLYARRGAVRSEIAEAMLRRLDDRLTPSARNNLRIQVGIGRLLRGEGGGWRELGRFPCNPVLYAKLWVYFVFRGRFGLVDFYGR